MVARDSKKVAEVPASTAPDKGGKKPEVIATEGTKRVVFRRQFLLLRIRKRPFRMGEMIDLPAGVADMLIRRRFAREV